jgi:hypothetical protein
MINRIDTSLIKEFLPNAGKKEGPAKPSALQPDAAIQVAYGDLIAGAMDNPETSEMAVEKAKDLVTSGKIDSAEYIQEAAQNMLALGV